jgi:alanyl aminopeptidase
MPSYLVGLAVGALEFTSIEGASVPGRIVTVTGKSTLIMQAAREAPALLAGLEAYLGTPLHYPKLDFQAVPGHKPGAEEDPGVISYQDSEIYRSPDDQASDSRERLAYGLAHEMAHMWFGNLVTAQWWNDLWLNETLAEWATYKVAGQIHQDFRFESRRSLLEAVRWSDMQPSARPIRRFFGGGDSYAEAFDNSLTYQKGSAVVNLVENWVGARGFQAAVQRYLRLHEWGNARAEDFWATLAQEGDGSAPEILRLYLDLPGIPEVSFSRLPGDRLQVHQRRYRTLGASKVTEQLWHIPMVISYGNASNAKTVRLLLKQQETVFNVPGIDQATWMYPDSGGIGYYIWSLPPDLIRSLPHQAAAGLSATERKNVLEFARAAVLSGRLSTEDLLYLAIQYCEDEDLKVIDLVFRALGDIADLITADDQLSFKGRTKRCWPKAGSSLTILLA